MIAFEKDGRTMEVYSDIQATAFEKAGWKRVTAKPATPDVPVHDIEALKAEADALGLTYHPHIGYEKLAERVAEAKRG